MEAGTWLPCPDVWTQETFKTTSQDANEGPGEILEGSKVSNLLLVQTKTPKPREDRAAAQHHRVLATGLAPYSPLLPASQTFPTPFRILLNDLLLSNLGFVCLNMSIFFPFKITFIKNFTYSKIYSSWCTISMSISPSVLKDIFIKYRILG